MLINDGFATHESLELLKFCFENNIILCRLPSRTSHKLQPCGIGMFGPLKTAYREQVEQLYHGGANTVGKQHFTLLYNRDRDAAFTCHNVKSGGRKAGLYPFNPDLVLRDIQTPRSEFNICPNLTSQPHPQPSTDLLLTLVITESLTSLSQSIEQEGCMLNETGQYQFRKLANVAEKAFADHALFLDENRLLFEQNNEKTTRMFVKATVIGTAKVMSYEEIVNEQEKREARVANMGDPPQRGRKPKVAFIVSDQQKRPRLEEAEKADREIKALGLGEFCSILQL